MSHPTSFLCVVLCVLATGCRLAGRLSGGGEMQPPMAKVIPTTLEKHGHVRTDDYYWLNQRDNPDVVAYLEAENEYTDAVLGHTEDMQQALFDEIIGRIKKTDMSVPYKLDDYYYYSRQEEGMEYSIYCRKRESLGAHEEIMLDVNQLAVGHDFISVRGRAVSMGQDILAYALDTKGRRIYDIHFKDLATGRNLPDIIPHVTGNMAWAKDIKTFYYAKQDPATLRSYQIWRHVLGTDPAGDDLVFEEKDDTFSTYVFRTKSKKYMMIVSAQTLSTEYRYLDLDDPAGEFKMFLPRRRDHEYSVDHLGDDFYIRSNDQAKNFRLMATSINNTARENWREIIAHRDDVLLEDFELIREALVVQERREGLRRIRIIPWSGENEHELEFDDPAYLAYLTGNYELDTQVFRFAYQSMTTPNSIYDYNISSRTKVLRKRQEVLGGFDSSDYATQRLHAVARDGTRVPISILYRKGMKLDRGNPLLLYGYGSYGATMDAGFSSTRLSLVDRGFVYAIAHIRGGQEMGRQWYEDGKLFNKKNTFTDFIDCAEHLVDAGYTSPDSLYAMGGSAGGLLMGAITNMRPDLFDGVVARVPFVDVVTTMLDDSIPLTTGEYDEWGNPNQKDYYDYILSYSPYDNVEAKDYPHLLVTTGLHDSQVQYWEPAKWVAKLRALKTDDNRVLLKTNMGAGHGGASGRFKRHRETALTYAFLLDLAGVVE
ncbi:MAG: S9 family peptidase [Planctomycetes bacterium]|nr:S9 family peptidase [Planctomycetota bacterium]